MHMSEEDKNKQREEEQNKKDEEKDSGNKNDETSSDNEERKDKEKELEDLLKTLKKLEEEKQKTSRKRKGPSRMIMVEFGATFHSNGLINFLMYFSMNLVVIMGLFELFNLVDFQRDLFSVLLFVLLYTFLEMLFRNYVLLNHFRFVMRTFGFIFFFGYLTLFFLLERYAFGFITFPTETHIILFVAVFITVRYVLSHLIRHAVLKAMR